MFLSKLEIHGFKSFANKVALEFPTPGNAYPVTAIVGPNGSGKSNLVDAIRWVLGEQSMKHLRGKRHEDIIFSGSETKSRLGYAEVAMTLDNSDRTMPVDFPEVVIARRLYRDGESEYLLNGRNVRLSDIILLLAQSHMGQRTYSVIGQGMVDYLLLASPRERKSMIDEAAGVRPYELKRNDAIARLELTRSNLLQAQTVLAEIEPRLRTLTRMVKRLERRSQLEKEAQTLKLQYYGTLWQQSSEAMKNVQTRLDGLTRQLTAIGQRQRELKKQREKMEREEPSSTKLMDLQKRYEAASEEREKLKERQWSIKMSINASTPHAPPRHLEKELQTIIAEHETIVETFKTTARAKDPGAMLAALEGLVGKLKALLRRGTMASTVDAPPPELESLRAAIKRCDDEMISLKGDMKRVEEEERSSRTILFKLQEELHRVERQWEESERAVNEATVERARLETRQEDLAAEIQKALEAAPAVAFADPIVPPRQPLEEMAKGIARLQHEIELIGGIDPEITQEYATTNERATFLRKETQDLEQSLKELEDVIASLDATMKRQFNEAFERISKEFSRYFTELFGGGKATLLMLQEEEPENGDPSESPLPPGEGQGEGQIGISKYRSAKPTVAGIDIHASPPGKRLKSVAALSGGEKALAAIALLCAILSYHPSPFVVLDEVDAALDEANSLRYANILRQLSRKTQFIVVTHNRTTMHIAQTFYGVTMGADGISQILSMKLEEVEETTPAS